MASSEYHRNVYLNCPFDTRYQRLFDAIVFAVSDCGFRPRCALEIEDSSQERMEKILLLIAACQLSITDLSRAGAGPGRKLARFNMPLELGLFLGAQRFGRAEQKKKVCLILDRDERRYRTSISNLAGKDVRGHRDEPLRAITVVRDWLRKTSADPRIPGGGEIGERYVQFRQDLPALRRELRIAKRPLIFVDYSWIVFEWLKRNA